MELVLYGKEFVKFRVFDENTAKCSNFVEKIIFCKENSNFLFENISNTPKTLSFELQTSKNFPGSCEIDELNDKGKIIYWLKAFLYTDTGLLSKKKLKILINEYDQSPVIKDFLFPIKRCCCNYGVIQVEAELIKPS